MSQAEEAPTTPALTVADLNTDVNHEARILDTRLAGALGFKDPHKIRPLIRRHLTLLRQRGAISATVAENPGRGRPGKAFWLNRKQALLICMKSETPRAEEIAMRVIDVYDAYVSDRTALPPPEEPKAAPRPEPDPEPAPKPHAFMDLYVAACAAFNAWYAAGLVTDDSRAMWIALQAVCDVAGVDARLGPAAGVKRRRQ